MNTRERDELQSVLRSKIFVRAPRQAKLLRYICNEYFEGRGDQVKEYTVATEVFGRTADFDQTSDPIVRVEAYRLRQKLKAYYDKEGADHPVRIVVDPGRYFVRFACADASTPLPRPTDVVPIRAIEDPTAKSPSEHPRGIAARIRDLADRRVLWVTWGGLVMISLTALIAAGWWIHRAKIPSASRPSSPAVAPAAGAVDSVRILCGYEKETYIDRDGKTWQGDRYYSGGKPSGTTAGFIARTANPTLFRSSREGDFSYDIPLKPGTYELRLYFVETQLGPGTLVGGGETGRLFNVQMNGKPLLEMFDIIKDAGGNDVADVRVFKDVTPAPDGYLHLRFEPVTYTPLLNALEIEPSTPGKINPIRIATRENPYTDSSGLLWSSDHYYSGGQAVMHITRLPVRRASDPNLYSSERYGNFSYALPVAPGKYMLTLRFAETYWGVETYIPGKPEDVGGTGGGEGSRVFDVYCNGVALLQNFDIFKEAGGPLAAINKTFHNLQPNAQGKILLSFVPVKNYAKVTAIELISEPD